MTTSICHDGRRPAPLRSEHGMHHWQARLPVTRRRHLYLSLTTGRYFVPMVKAKPHLLRVAVPFAEAALVRSSNSVRPSVSHMRWCAHIKVTTS